MSNTFSKLKKTNYVFSKSLVFFVNYFDLKKSSKLHRYSNEKYLLFHFRKLEKRKTIFFLKSSLYDVFEYVPKIQCKV